MYSQGIHSYSDINLEREYAHNVSVAALSHNLYAPGQSFCDITFSFGPKQFYHFRDLAKLVAFLHECVPAVYFIVFEETAGEGSIE